MILLPRSTSHSSKRFRRQHIVSGVAWPCAVCDTPVPSPKFIVRIVNGGSHIGTDAEGDANPAADLGYHPIGLDCLRRHPEIKPFAVKAPSDFYKARRP